MTADKIRIKKYQKLKVQQWCEALLVSESRFVEDAIGFYLRYLEGKHPVTPILPLATTESLNGHQELSSVKPVAIETDSPEEFDGGIEL
ncbi:hypothetical protein SD80_012725 [Scytonema tolypothrichoides VB-61278]|nr:hypothetical protein SD80_012725 [Scytonema tolypothrichoides VB-61278]